MQTRPRNQIWKWGPRCPTHDNLGRATCKFAFKRRNAVRILIIADPNNPGFPRASVHPLILPEKTPFSPALLPNPQRYTPVPPRSESRQQSPRSPESRSGDSAPQGGTRQGPHAHETGTRLPSRGPAGPRDTYLSRTRRRSGARVSAAAGRR